MTRYGRVGTAPRIIVLVLALIVLVLSGFIWFDFLGLIDVQETLAPVLGLVGIRTRTRIEEPQAPDLLDQQRLNQQWEALELRAEELQRIEEAQDTREAELIQMMEKVQEQEKVLEEREKSFNARIKQYENRNANLREVSTLFVNMPPAEAVARLVEMEDQDVIDILRTTDTVAEETGENSVSSYWLQLMPADRSARIQEKMLDKPG
jgi:flagellar protein FlbB